MAPDNGRLEIVYQELREFRQEQRAANRDLAARFEKRLSDHEKRLRSVETWQARWMGKVAAIGALVSAVVSWLAEPLLAWLRGR